MTGAKIKKPYMFFIMVIIVMLFTGCSSGVVQVDDKQGGQDISQEDKTQSTAVQDGSDVKVTNTGADTGNGRFLESETALPQGISKVFTMAKLDDGSLEAIGSDELVKNYYILKSKDTGKTWNKKKIKGLSKEYYPVTCISIAPDGRAAFTGYGKKKNKAYIEILDADGHIKSLETSLPETANTDENFIIQSVYSKQGDLFAVDLYGSLLKINASDGKCSQPFDTKGVSASYIGISGNMLIAVHSSGIMLFDTDKETELSTESTLNDIIAKDNTLSFNDTDAGLPMYFAQGAADGQLIFANKNGIFSYMTGGSITELLVDASLTSLNDGGAFTALEVPDKDNILLVLNNDGNGKILHYTYDKNAKAMPDKELKVYALDDSSMLRKAVTLFQKKYPDVSVRLETGLSGDDGVTLEDALSTLNTNILAGKGPDVLILDGMPADSYIEKGILADITDVADEIDKEDGILPNIKEGSKKDGKIYALPARFLIEISECDSSIADAGSSLKELAEMAEKLKQKDSGKNVIDQAKGTITFLRDLYYADSASWIKDGKSIDKDSLKEYLECAKQLYDVDSNEKRNDFRGDGTLEGIKAGTFDFVSRLTGNSQISFGFLSGFGDVQNMASAWKQKKGSYCLLNSAKVKSYIPYLQAGVAAGGNEDMAKEFIKILLGKKLGNSDMNGFPVNKAAYTLAGTEKLDSKAVKIDSGYSMSDKDGNSFSVKMANLTKAQLDQFDTVVESLEKPALTNRVIQEIVLGQAEKYLLGEQNLENTADTVLKKVNLYLAE